MPRPHLAALRGLGRSLWTYYRDPSQRRRTERFYAQFLGSGDLGFDIGAHVGSRTFAWVRLGARVVAVEPNPDAMHVLQALYGRHPRVALVQSAVGSQTGTLPMLVCEREPAIATLSADWAQRMLRERDAFVGVAWHKTTVVPVMTLEELIVRYGEPAFCKIDVEGYDIEVLRGLCRPLRALSFEYVPPALDLALDCLRLVDQLGSYEFNWSAGESMQFYRTDWVTACSLVAYLENYPMQGTPGDVYARLLRT